MPKIVTFLSEDIAKNLKELSKNSGKPLSKITSELVEIGYQINQNKGIEKLKLPDEIWAEFNSKSMEYLLRILNIDSEILRKLNNEPSKCPGKNTELKLAEIKNYAKKHVEDMQKNHKVTNVI